MIIAVIGASDPPPEVARLAEQVGAALARRGATVVCGGLGGVMESACRGAKSAGGDTVGILPGSDPDEANQWVDVPVCTGMGYARNVIVVKTGRAVISVGGAYGTLSEMAHALSFGIPVVALASWSFSKNGVEDGGPIRAESAEDAVEKALEAAKHAGGSE